MGCYALGSNKVRKKRKQTIVNIFYERQKRKRQVEEEIIRKKREKVGESEKRL